MDGWEFVEQGSDNLERILRYIPPQRPFVEWLGWLIKQKGLRKADVARRSRLNRTFAYQIMSGKRHASRNKLIQLAFGMGLSITTTNELLERSGHNRLDPHNKRDVVIAYCLVHALDVGVCNEHLLREGLEMLMD